MKNSMWQSFKQWLSRQTIVELLIYFCILAIVYLLFFVPIYHGQGWFGKKSNVDCTVQRLYVDMSGRSSHYMVGTDKGVYEVGNGFLIGIWNADEIYADIKEGRSYHFTTRGNKALGMFYQYYPFIVKVEPLTKPEIPYGTVPGKE